MPAFSKNRAGRTYDCRDMKNEIKYFSMFTKENHERLAESLRNIKGKWLLSYNNHAQIRKLYRGCKIKKVTTKYSGSTRSGKHKETEEIIITNY